MKKMLVLTLVLVFALSGLVLAADTNEGNIRQIGTWNVAAIDQKGDINLADVNQTGNSNSAYVYQEDYQALNTVTTLVEQTGNFNQASVWQYGSKYHSMAKPRTVKVLQSGESNTAFVVQATGGQSSATIDQSGELNKAAQWQTHELENLWEVAMIRQTGSSNQALQRQLGIDGNLWAAIYQTGNDNIAVEIQSRSVVTKNTARITQRGESNFGIVTQ